MTRDDKARILIVDGDSDSRSRMKQALRPKKYLVEQAAEEMEGLQKVSSFEPDLILLDINIPVMDELMICQQLKQSSHVQNLRVIMLTPETRCSRTLECLQSGANDFITKPFRRYDLLTRVELQLKTKERLDSLVRENEELCLIQSMIHTLYEKQNIYDLLYTLVTQISQTINVARCSFVRIRGDGETGVVEASSDGPGIRGLEIDIRKYPEIRKVYETKEVLIIEDTRSEPILAPVRSYLEKTPFQSLVLIPVIDQDEIVGTLVLRTARPGESFSARELRFLKAVAEASRPAILNAHLFEAVEEKILHASIETGGPGDGGPACQEVLQDRAKAMLEQCYQLKDEVRRLKGLQEEIRKQRRPFPG